MIRIGSSCIKNGAIQNCKYCNAPSIIKNGLASNGQQRYKCRECRRRFLGSYKNRACLPEANDNGIALKKEGCSVRSISRLLQICFNTVLKKILFLSQTVCKPMLYFGKTYEVDELCTYIGNKNNRIWIAYAYCGESRSVVDFAIGTRSKMTLEPLINKLLDIDPKKIYTDKHPTYATLIPKQMHSTIRRGTNHIEPMKLTLRTHLKRLNRRTICFSKSAAMLQACLMIYFFG